MNVRVFRWLCCGIALTFAGFFAAVVLPAVLRDGDIVGAFAAGFVNPYASGYSLDVLLCWLTLLVWVLHDARTYRIRHGWICVMLGVVPGVAVGFPLYLVARSYQLREHRDEIAQRR